MLMPGLFPPASFSAELAETPVECGITVQNDEEGTRRYRVLKRLLPQVLVTARLKPMRKKLIASLADAVLRDSLWERFNFVFTLIRPERSQFIKLYFGWNGPAKTCHRIGLETGNNDRYVTYQVNRALVDVVTINIGTEFIRSPEFSTRYAGQVARDRTPLADLDLDAWVLSIFWKNGILTVGDIEEYTVDEISAFREIGEKRLSELLGKLREHKVSLK